jgi:hypothetical protein
MKFIRPGATPTGSSGGDTSMPSWRQRWIEEKVQRVVLECGCIEDLSIPVLTLINAFDGASIDCVKHHRFAKVVKKLKPPKTQYPADPLF